MAEMTAVRFEPRGAVAQLLTPQAPEVVLAGPAVLLLLAAGGTWLAKRIQSRRVNPTPAPARRD